MLADELRFYIDLAGHVTNGNVKEYTTLINEFKDLLVDQKKELMSLKAEDVVIDEAVELDEEVEEGDATLEGKSEGIYWISGGVGIAALAAICAYGLLKKKQSAEFSDDFLKYTENSVTSSLIWCMIIM